MASEETYKSITIINPAPSGAGGLHVQNNLKSLADSIEALEAADGVNHTHTNKTILDAITDAGSGAVISDAERTTLNSALQSVSDDTNAALGSDLDTNSFKVDGGEVTLNWQSPTVDFTSLGSTTIFTVPASHRIAIDSIEIITTGITTPGIAPTLTIGDSGDADSLITSTQSQSNSDGSRHIFRQPKDLMAAGTAITATVSVASTAAAHTGYVILCGKLLEV